MQSALELYYLDNGSYPATDSGLSALVEAPAGVASWNGPYIKGNQAMVDAWGTPLSYSYAEGSSEPLIRSYGRDGQEGGEGLDSDLGQ